MPWVILGALLLLSGAGKPTGAPAPQPTPPVPQPGQNTGQPVADGVNAVVKGTTSLLESFKEFINAVKN